MTAADANAAPPPLCGNVMKDTCWLGPELGARTFTDTCTLEPHPDKPWHRGADWFWAMTEWVYAA